MAIVDRRGVAISAGGTANPGTTDPSIAIKAPVKAASTGSNLTLSGLLTLDDYALVAGDRVLVMHQDDSSENGIYNAAAGDWERASDCQQSIQIGDGMICYVRNGTISARRAYQASITTPFVLDTDAFLWTAAELPNSAIEINISSAQDAAIGTGIKGYHHVPFDCTITEADLVADASGSIVIDIYKAVFPAVPDSSMKITGSTPPTLSGARSSLNTSLTGWTVALRKGDVLAFDVTSVAGLKFVTLTLPVSRD